MNVWKIYRIVFRKEFRELLRDRRALFLWEQHGSVFLDANTQSVVAPALALISGTW